MHVTSIPYVLKLIKDKIIIGMVTAQKLSLGKYIKLRRRVYGGFLENYVQVFFSRLLLLPDRIEYKNGTCRK